MSLSLIPRCAWMRRPTVMLMRASLSTETVPALKPTTARVSDGQLTLLRDALKHPKPFHGQGRWTFPANQLLLFLSKEPHLINLARGGAMANELAGLMSACQPATFGMDQVDVLDETYRKAGKLDNIDFALNLDIFGSGLLEKVNDALFGWEAARRDIRPELYKLNVYDEGSFFKAHVDTPRGLDMFGSLVITFPTRHEGGQLALRHGGQEVTHDTASGEYDSDSQVSWAAFFSDVEHEVLPVTSGHRVTLTYNLYFSQQVVPVRDATPDDLLNAFKALVADETFMPDGGRLGFGLKHGYPVSDKRDLSGYHSILKGEDSALYYAVVGAGLKPEMKLVYSTSDEEAGLHDLLMDKVWGGDRYQHEDLAHDLKAMYGAEMISETTWDGEENKLTWTADDLVWVEPWNDHTSFSTEYVRWGNEAWVTTAYGKLALLARVPPAAQRRSAV